MAYDAVGNLRSITDSVGNITRYTYDVLDRQITDTNSLGKIRTFGYDAVGNRIQSIDRNGRKISYGYDALNRQTSENWLDASNNNIRTFGYGYDAVGHLLTSIDPDSKYTYTYDAIDRITSIDNAGTVGVPAVKFAYNYDAVGNLVSVTDAIDGVSAGMNAYTYDVLNRATRITQSGTGVQGKRVDMNYDAVNRLTGLNRYGDLAGTQSVADSTYAYDAAGRLTNLVHQRGASTIASYGFAYDVANRITQKSGTDGVEDYSYDETNQLTAVDNSSRADEAYSYDANGNRTNAGYGTGTNNQLLTDGVYNYTYDNEGNRTTRTEISTGKVTEYVWDYRNRLTSVTFKDASGNVVKSIAYTYDVNDRRIGKTIDGVVAERYVYDGDDIALVFDGAGVQTHRYLHGTAVDQVLTDETSTGVVWALADNLGSVRDVIDGNGVVLNHVTYDSYGRVISQTNPTVEFRYGYTGREQDSETGLDYYRARYYDSAVGRFISEDPIGFAAGDTNVYRYVFNSPTNFVDPSGNAVVAIPVAAKVVEAVLVTGSAIIAAKNINDAREQAKQNMSGVSGGGVSERKDSISLGQERGAADYIFPNPNRDRLSLGDNGRIETFPNRHQHPPNFHTPGFDTTNHTAPRVEGFPDNCDPRLVPPFFSADTYDNEKPSPALEGNPFHPDQVDIRREQWQKIYGSNNQPSAIIPDRLNQDLQKLVGQSDYNKFQKALNKGIVGPVGQSGIKVLNPPVGDYTHELKIGGSGQRILGKVNENGQIVFDKFVRGGLH